MNASASELVQRLPGKASQKWPMGEPFISAFAHGTMSVELYSPVGIDAQTPHAQDELYFIHAGTGDMLIDGARHTFGPGSAFFVAAGVEHRFENFTSDFCTWVVFWGPQGGERTV
jgi:mannose-6-phosphate isomerase-like protein (cupin superfamily)